MDKLPSYYTRSGTKEEDRYKIVKIIHRDLASCLDLAAMCKQAHWNVKGHNFIAIHRLFDEIYEYLAGVADTLGERIAAYGHTALAGAKYVIENSYITPYPDYITHCDEHCLGIADRLATLANTYSISINELDNIGSKVTSNVYQDIVFNLDKYLYFLEAHYPKTIDAEEESAIENNETEGPEYEEPIYAMVEED